MATVHISPEQLFANPVLCHKMVGSQVNVKVSTAVVMVTGHFLYLDPGNGKCLTLVVRNQDSGRNHILFVYTSIVTDLTFDEGDRLSEKAISEYYANKLAITA